MSFTKRTASGPILLYMKAFSFIGLAVPPSTIYLAPGHETDEVTIRHEACHIEQMHRDGTFTFLLRYTFQIIRYGYWNAPYEIEARAAETIQDAQAV